MQSNAVWSCGRASVCTWSIVLCHKYRDPELIRRSIDESSLQEAKSHALPPSHQWIQSSGGITIRNVILPRIRRSRHHWFNSRWPRLVIWSTQFVSARTLTSMSVWCPWTLAYSAIVSFLTLMKLCLADLERRDNRPFRGMNSYHCRVDGRDNFI